MPNDGQSIRLSDGSLDFSLGVDSASPTTVQSPANPNGLSRQALAWMINATCRGGGITQRPRWQQLASFPANIGIYQGGWLYEPQLGNPYLMFQIGGFVWQVRVDTNNAVNQVTTPGEKDVNNTLVANPPTVPQAYMTQGEQFLVIQAGDWAVNQAGTLPLFWDGSAMRRSRGIIGPGNIPGGVQPFNELPAALSMTYFQGHLWYANGRQYNAGDTVNNPASGTVTYGFDDSVLKVTESPLAIGGDGFVVPTSAGAITALTYTAQLDATLGQGNLYIATRRQINSLVVPPNRTAWVAASAAATATTGTQPQQLVAQIRYGTCSERGVVRVNGDLFYGSPEPAIRSLTISTRYFRQWGNLPLSRNIRRALSYTSANLLSTQTGINFDNRMLMGLMPKPTPLGVAFPVLAPLDFDLISTLENRLPPAWEGILEGLDILQLFEGDFGGTQRAFAAVSSRTSQNTIEVWELTSSSFAIPATNTTDSPDNRVQWAFETPAYTWNKEGDLKQLEGGEVWIDRVVGTVDIQFFYRQDAAACWVPWAQTQFCSARNTCEDVNNPVCYPTQPYAEGQKFPLVLPAAQPRICNESNLRPTNIGYQFQMKAVIKGFCRVRGVMLYAVVKNRETYPTIAQAPQPKQ